MKIALSEKGHVEEFKPLKELEVKYGIAPESSLGEDYYFFGINEEAEISKILIENDQSIDFKIYLNKDIIYLVFPKESFYYTIRIYHDDLKLVRRQILKEKKILFFIYNNEQQLVSSYIYDIIM